MNKFMKCPDCGEQIAVCDCVIKLADENIRLRAELDKRNVVIKSVHETSREFLGDWCSVEPPYLPERFEAMKEIYDATSEVL